jgi:O-antigen chain-terminating methyltransferase
VLILETPNPRNILVGSGDFYRDPTHNNPVFPDSLAFMARQRGFARGNIFWKESAALIPAKESTFDTLTDYVNVGRDYAYIGYVPCV